MFRKNRSVKKNDFTGSNLRQSTTNYNNSKFLESIQTQEMQFATQPTQTTSSKSTPSYYNSKLVDHLITDGEVKSSEVEKVMKSIDRADFSYYDPYADR